MSVSVLYNENDRFASLWLENLVSAGLISDGFVDSRSIKELGVDDVRGKTFHTFAGIGVWDYALRLAGWPDDVAVWTGSCPCQPFSVAGKRDGEGDARHLWPDWYALVEKCRPEFIFGEQVASADGRAWLDAVSIDLEGLGYAIGSADLCAAGVGAPHIRQRLYWVAYSHNTGLERRWECGNGSYQRSSRSGGVAVGPWESAEWIPCSDGKTRPVEPGTFPLAARSPGRVGKLRAYGNSIVPQVASVFIRAAMESIGMV